MPYTPKQRTRKQRQRRRAGQIKRLEVILNADSARDQTIYNHLIKLERGEVAEFVRAAIAEKIMRDSNTPTTPEPADQLNAILQQLARLQETVKIPRVEHLVTAALTPAAPELIISSSLDMSGPRRQRDRPPEPSRCSPPIEAEFDADDAARRLLASIKAYGKEARRGR